MLAIIGRVLWLLVLCYVAERRMSRSSISLNMLKYGLNTVF